MGSGSVDYPEFLDMMAHKILNRDPVEEINKAFKLFDDDNTGRVTFKNLKRVAKELGERLTDEELQEMIDEADRDGDGEVGNDEFQRIMKKTWMIPSISVTFMALAPRVCQLQHHPLQRRLPRQKRLKCHFCRSPKISSESKT